MNSLKTTFKVLLLTAITLLVLVLMVCTVLLEFHIDYELERKDAQPIELLAEYVVITGDPLCSQLYSLEPEKLEGSVVPRVPNGVPDPHDVELVLGNKIKLKGYRYHIVRRNLITRSVEKRPTTKFAIIEWSAEPDHSYVVDVKNVGDVQFSEKSYTVCR